LFYYLTMAMWILEEQVFGDGKSNIKITRYCEHLSDDDQKKQAGDYIGRMIKATKGVSMINCRGCSSSGERGCMLNTTSKVDDNKGSVLIEYTVQK